jgi:adenosylcobinamide-GDP ribazoletransferase
MKPANDLVAAMRFLTRVPLPASLRATGFGAGAFPVVGLLIGACALIVDVITRALPTSVRNVAILAVWAILTGAIHYDGLADTLDGFGAAGREERLRVMRDASVGVFAVLGLVLVIAAQLAALGALDGSARTSALLAAPALGRWAMVLTGVGARSARPEGLGAAFTREVTGLEAGVATVVTIVSLTLVAGRVVWIACVLAAAAAAGMRRIGASAFGGVTGDLLGAAGVIVETLTLMLFAAR